MRAPAHAWLRRRRRRHGRHRRGRGTPRGGDAERAKIALVVARGADAQRDGARGQRRSTEQAREVQHLRGGGARAERGRHGDGPNLTSRVGRSHATHAAQRDAPRADAAPIVALPERQAPAQRRRRRLLPPSLRLGRRAGRKGGHRAHIPQPRVGKRSRRRARALSISR